MPEDSGYAPHKPTPSPFQYQAAAQAPFGPANAAVKQSNSPPSRSQAWNRAKAKDFLVFIPACLETWVWIVILSGGSHLIPGKFHYQEDYAQLAGAAWK